MESVDFQVKDHGQAAIHRTRLSLYLSWETGGHWSANSQLVNGVKGIGTNVDLMNTLTPFTPAVYYYDKIPQLM